MRVDEMSQVAIMSILIAGCLGLGTAMQMKTPKIEIATSRALYRSDGFAGHLTVHEEL